MPNDDYVMSAVGSHHLYVLKVVETSIAVAKASNGSINLNPAHIFAATKWM
ncbi:hypothetical protein D3C84_1238260 [compost metagenome]